MFCASCGRENPLAARFCGHCGTALVPHNTVEPPPAAGSTTDGSRQDLALRLRDSRDRFIGPVAEQLRRVDSKNSSQKKNAKNFIRNDLMTTFVHFATIDGPVAARHAQFFIQVFGLLDTATYVNLGVDTAQGFLANLAKSESFLTPLQKPLTVTLLEGYDGLHGTQYAREAITLFADLANATISANDAVLAKDRAELERFKELLNATTCQPDASANREGQTSPVKPTNPIVLDPPIEKQDELHRLATDFRTFATTLSSKVNEMLKSATILGPTGEPQDLRDFKQILGIDLLVLAATFSKIAGSVSYATAEFVFSFMNGTDGAGVPTPLAPEAVGSIKKIIDGQWAKVPVSPVEPITVSTLGIYDETFETHYADESRNLFVRLVSALGKEAAASGETCRSLVQQYTAVLTPHTQKCAEAAAMPIKDSGRDVSVDSFDGLLAELQGLIGLAKVKKDVEELANYIKVQQLRKSRGLKTPELSLHMVFYGNPGTGKTTVARLLAKIYKSLGVVTQGQVVETDRSGLIAGYVGQTALKVKQVVERALGGILFIDEAYALKPKSDLGDFGDEAIETLLKLMEDKRGNLIVIVAGYPDEMSHFLGSNPGLESRFNRYLTFDDYTPDELLRIFQRFCRESQYELDSEAASKLEILFRSAFQQRDAHFGNARLARNAFEQAIMNMATRIVDLAKVEDSALEIIQAIDIPNDIMSGVRASS